MKPRENPFRVSRLESLAFRDPGGATVETVLDRLRAAHGRGAVIGPHGTGKTTLVRELAERLSLQGLVTSSRAATPLRVSWFQIRTDRSWLDRAEWRTLRHAGARAALVIDGADLLSRPVWPMVRFAARRAAVLLVTSHARPLLMPIHRTSVTPELLESLVDELVDGAPSPLRHDAGESLARHCGDVREALRALYDSVGGTASGKPS